MGIKGCPKPHKMSFLLNFFNLKKLKIRKLYFVNDLSLSVFAFMKKKTIGLLFYITEKF